MQSEQLNAKRGEEARASSFRQQDLVKKAAQVAGQNTAALGGAGLDTSSGLGFDAGAANWSEWLNNSNRELLNLYASDRNIRQEQNNLAAQALGFDQQAGMYRKQAKSAKQAGLISALGTLALSAATSGVLKGSSGAAKGVSKGAGAGMMGSYGEMIRLPV
jgi:hypothetical protein